MIPPGLPAALAVLLGCAAAYELAGRGGGSSFAGARARGGEMSAAVRRLGIPGRLRRAGMGDEIPVTAVLAAKAASAALATLVASAAAPAAPGRLAVMVWLGFPTAGFMGPDALLERVARRRRRRIVAALPDALDLLAVGSAAGRSATAGLGEVARSGRGPLAEELAITVAEVSCGEPQAEALNSLRRRVPGSEVAALCAALDRSRRLGSPLADQLRRQASSLRRDQRRVVEERAARAAPKIQLVVALVLVPSVLLMIVAGLFANSDRLLSGF